MFISTARCCRETSVWVCLSV